MITAMHPWLATLGYMLSAVAMGYGVVALVTWRGPKGVSPRLITDAPPVTLLKPLCGEEPETYECLRSFCEQAYPEFQIVFGVSDESDPALAAVRRLQSEFPQRDLQIALDPRRNGSNRKVSNLINMMPLARHDYLILSDDDIKVKSDYLQKVVAPFSTRGWG